MQTMYISEKTGSDGILHLRIPVGQANAEFDVVVMLQPKTDASALIEVSSFDWPPGYFEQTFGSITDETFVRPPQGELPNPVELE
jgi:hypothetical protein